MLFGECVARQTCRREGKIAEHRIWCALINSHIADADQALLLIGPGVALQVVIERLVPAFEALHAVVLFEAPNDNSHSIPHGPNKGFGGVVRFLRRYEPGKTLQFPLRPLDLDAWQGNVRGHSFQPGKQQHVSLPARALADDPVA